MTVPQEGARRVPLQEGAFVDCYRQGPLSRYVTARRSLGDGLITMIEARQPAGDMSNPPLPGLNLVQHLAGRRIDAEYGPVKFSKTAEAGTFCLSVPGEASRVLADRAHAIRIFWIPGPMLPDEPEGSGEAALQFGPLHHGPFADAFLGRFVRQLWTDGAAAVAAPRLYAESAAHFLVQRLVAVSAGARAPRRGGLAPWQVRRVEDYMRASLARDMGVGELAGIVGLTAKHFARAFREATGTPPHRFLTGIRIEAAARMLDACRERPLADVAIACGFADQSHFTRSFRAVMGTTPGLYRRQRPG
jgi:AraC family transcriptional regulator